MGIDVRRMFTGRGLVVTVVAAGVLAGGGATAAVAAGHGDDRGRGAVPSDDDRHDDHPADGSPEPAVSLAQAVDAALKAVSGKVEEVELDGEHGKTVWEVGVLAGNGARRDVTVDSGTGKVLANRADDRDEEGKADSAALRKAEVTAPAAAGAALKAVPGHAVSAEFRRGHRGAVWEVEVIGRNGAEHEVAVDAATGKVLGGGHGED
ncbi:PepSY domain-containing protein [Actinomadura formosensis]|uniref:PepSY domain-containing protein n=1 Tax=Actinomadura formosensis TaxID=60706 RepID=UPI00082DEC71|nr:PepSY domain-containing protein [Actinomadura formosensis]